MAYSATGGQRGAGGEVRPGEAVRNKGKGQLRMTEDGEQNLRQDASLLLDLGKCRLGSTGAALIDIFNKLIKI